MGTSLADLQSPSAISSLLAQLTGGQQPNVPLQGPQAAQVPPAPAQPQGSPSLFHRVLSNLAGLPGAVAHGISEFERPQAPAEAQAAVQAGLLTPEQVQAARPSFLQSLIADHQPGGAQGQYNANLGLTDQRGQPLGILGVTQLAQGVQQQKAQRQVLADIARLYPITPGMTPDQLHAALQGIYTYGTAHGLSMDKLGEAIKPMFEPPKQGFEPKEFVNDKGEIAWVIPGQPVPAGFHQKEAAGAYTLMERSGATPAGQPPYVPLRNDDTAGFARLGAMGYKPATEQRQMVIQDLIGQRFADTRTDKAVTDYTNKLIAPQITRASAIDKAIFAVDAARNAPNEGQRRAMLGPAFSNFVQVMDQDKNLRQGMLQFYEKKIDSSIGGQWSILRDRLLKGELPPAVTDAMMAQLRSMRDMTKNEIEQKRNDLLTRRPDLVGALPQTESFFQPDNAPSSGPAGKPPLADRVDQLRKQGLSKEAARAQLQREGYDLSRP